MSFTGNYARYRLFTMVIVREIHFLFEYYEENLWLLEIRIEWRGYMKHRIFVVNRPRTNFFVIFFS